MHVSFYSRSFLTINEFILGKIQIITSHQRIIFIFYYFLKINIYAHVKTMYTICTNHDRYIVNDRQQ